MSKEVVTKFCTFCESEYKLSYDRENTSGFEKYCPFCAALEDDIEYEKKENDDN